MSPLYAFVDLFGQRRRFALYRIPRVLVLTGLGTLSGVRRSLEMKRQATLSAMLACFATPRPHRQEIRRFEVDRRLCDRGRPEGDGQVQEGIWLRERVSGAVSRIAQDYWPCVE